MSIAFNRPSKSALVVLIAALASGLWVPHQIKLVHARRWIVEAEARLNALRDRIAAASDSLESAQRELRAAIDRHDQTLAAVAKAERSLAARDPEARWTAPPASLPEWNADSPYIWLRKEMVPRLPVSPFTEDGGLRAEVGYVLVVDPVAQRNLNQQLKQLLGDYRALEIANAQPTEDHLPGIAGQPGEKLTIRVRPQPEEGARVKQQFEAALVDALGAQRAELLTKAGESWLGSEFAQFGAEPKIISVIRHPGGSFNISIKTGNNWMSTGGPASAIKNLIPSHFWPMFSKLFNPADAADPPKEDL
jgi:hypothetical protein